MPGRIMGMKNGRTLMRTVTLRVPDDWRGVVDSWAVQVMLKDFSQNHDLSELGIDPQPGHVRLSLSLPECRDRGIPESVFLRRLIASYLPALKSFRSSQSGLASQRLQGGPSEIGSGLGRQKALPTKSELRAEGDKHARGSDYRRPWAYGLTEFPVGFEKAGNSESARPLSGGSEIFLTVLIAFSIAAILVVLFFFRRDGVRVSKGVAGVPVPGYKPWIPKAL